MIAFRICSSVRNEEMQLLNCMRHLIFGTLDFRSPFIVDYEVAFCF